MKFFAIPLLLAFGIAFALEQTVAVLPSDGILKDEELVFFTDKAQEIAVRVLPKNSFEVFPQEVIIGRLGGADSYVKECKESSCIVDLGRKASVDYVAQCRFGKLGSDLTVTFELYKVSTSGLIDKFTESAKNVNGLLAIMEEKIPGGFMKIPGAAPQEKTAPSPVDSGNNGSTLTDKRDGKKYKVVKIGNQTWMAENLNYAASASKCHGNKPENCEKYGRLYNWETAKKICPSGWHLPSKSEYEELDKAVGGEKVAGKYLKAVDGWGWNDLEDISGNGTDKYGFSALPGGSGISVGLFVNAGTYGSWWSASESESDFAYRHSMDYIGEGANRNGYLKSTLLSVRCVKD